MNNPSELISTPDALKPGTTWLETAWAWTSEEELVNHESRTRLCGAALLPFAGAEPDWDGFIRSLGWMYQAAQPYGVEFVPVLNADTGYIFDLTNDLYKEVLNRFRAAFPGQKFIAGVTARGAEKDQEFDPQRYLPLLEITQGFSNCEVMIMTSRHLSALDAEPCRDAYYRIAEYLTHPGIVHALEPAFVPWARPFGPWLLHQLAIHPKFVGGKISTLDEPHFLYWAAMCRSLKLDFAPHSGDDFGIATAIKMGLPLLIGAAVTGAPLICAAKDMWLNDTVIEKRFKTGAGKFDTRVYKLLEVLQSMEDQVFRLDHRGSASAYKHSTAHFLHNLGLVAAPDTHPNCRDRRDSGEGDRMKEAAIRVERIARKLQIEGFERASLLS
ncbi:MAG: hypothetical protein JWN25_2751 [Verrucomicrobiales bacterium]|nr:hypothetical protein [Verrucomicrobiales bacterium]